MILATLLKFQVHKTINIKLLCNSKIVIAFVISYNRYFLQIQCSHIMKKLKILITSFLLNFCIRNNGTHISVYMSEIINKNNNLSLKMLLLFFFLIVISIMIDTFSHTFRLVLVLSFSNSVKVLLGEKITKG